jgi:hypothetical protein
MAEENSVRKQVLSAFQPHPIFADGADRQAFDTTASTTTLSQCEGLL